MRPAGGGPAHQSKKARADCWARPWAKRCERAPLVRGVVVVGLRTGSGARFEPTWNVPQGGRIRLWRQAGGGEAGVCLPKIRIRGGAFRVCGFQIDVISRAARLTLGRFCCFGLGARLHGCTPPRVGKRAPEGVHAPGFPQGSGYRTGPLPQPPPPDASRPGGGGSRRGACAASEAVLPRVMPPRSSQPRSSRRGVGLFGRLGEGGSPAGYKIGSRCRRANVLPVALLQRVLERGRAATRRRRRMRTSVPVAWGKMSCWE